MKVEHDDKQELIEEINTLSDNLVSLESKYSLDLCIEIKRSLHNLKGTLQMLGLVNIGEFFHEIEELFDKKVQDLVFLNLLLRYLNEAEESIANSLDVVSQSFVDELQAFSGSPMPERYTRAGIELFNEIQDQAKYVPETSKLIFGEGNMVYALLEDDSYLILKDILSSLDIYLQRYKSLDDIITATTQMTPEFIFVESITKEEVSRKIHSSRLVFNNSSFFFVVDHINDSILNSIRKDRNTYYLQKGLRKIDVVSKMVAAIEFINYHNLMASVVKFEQKVFAYHDDIKSIMTAKGDDEDFVGFEKAFKESLKARSKLQKTK